MTEWQPIETAIEDGSDILLYDPTLGDVVFGWRSVDGFVGGYLAKHIDPTHWMPLPPPPSNCESDK